MLEGWSYLFHYTQKHLALFHDSRVLALEVHEQHHYGHIRSLRNLECSLSELFNRLNRLCVDKLIVLRDRGIR